MHKVLLDQVAVLGHQDNWDHLDPLVIPAVQEILALKDQSDFQEVKGLLGIEEPKVVLEIPVQWEIKVFQGNKVHLESRELQDHQEHLVRLDLLGIKDFKVHLELQVIQVTKVLLGKKV